MTEEVHPLWKARTGDVLYRNLRDSEYAGDIREYLESLYNLTKMHLDRKFLSEFAKQPAQRWWEMFVANWLQTEPAVQYIGGNEKGPDFKVTVSFGEVLVEACMPWPKGSARRIDKQLRRGVGTIRAEDYLEAFTGACTAKSQQLAKFMEEKARPTIVCIGLGTGTDVDLAEDGDPPIPAQALLGIAPPVYPVPVGGENLDLAVGQYRPMNRETIKKQSGGEISVVDFLNGRLRGISALMYSRARYIDCPTATMKQVMILHNPTAVIPLPRGIFRNVTDYWVEGGFLVSSPDFLESTTQKVAKFRE